MSGVAASIAFDLRSTCRTLLRHPLFLVPAVLILGLGIGANAAVTGLAWAVLGAPLPFPEADRLVRIFHSDDLTFGVALSELLEYRQQARGLEDAAGWVVGGATLEQTEGSSRVVRARVTPNLFDVLGRQPAVGSGFEVDGSGAGVLLSNRFWRRHFGADPAVIGRVLRLDGESHPIRGVLPADVVFPDPSVDLVLPIDLSRPLEPGRSGPFLDAVGRLSPGVDPGAAAEEIAVLADGIRAADPGAYEAEPGFGGYLVPFREAEVRDDRRLLVALGAAATLLLLAACSSVATLLVARAEERKVEMTVRRALGAGATAIARLHLIEAAVLAVVGALVGGGVAVLFGRVLASRVAAGLALSGHGPALVVALATPIVALVTGLVIGLLGLPATSGRPSLSASSRTVSRGRGHLRRFLPPVQVALAVILLSGSILMVRTVRDLVSRDLGYAVEGVLTARISLPEERYGSPTAQGSLFRELRARLGRRPEVVAAGLVNALPLTGYGGSGDVTVQSIDPDSAVAVVTQRIAGPHYFPAAGIPLLAGRPFGEEDRADAPRVALVDERFARRFFADPQDALGQRVRFFFGGDDWNEIVGVVGHVRDGGPGTEGGPQIYAPLSQRSTGSLHLVVRFGGDVAPVAAAVRSEVGALDPLIPLYDVASMQERLGGAIQRERFALTVFSAFGLLALLLAGVGTYAVLALSQRRRVHEIGIRRALGAPAAAVVGAVARTGAAGLVAGCLVGSAGAMAMAALLERTLETVAGGTLVPVAVAVAVLTVTAGIATLPPTLRALRVDPARIMRAD